MLCLLFYIVMLRVIVLNAKCCYAGCHYAECCGAQLPAHKARQGATTLRIMKLSITTLFEWAQ
jgi:hypothetical protein